MDNAAEAIERVREADDEAHAAQVAFVSGDFDTYWREKCQDAIDRIEATSEQYRSESDTTRRDHEADS